jgi:predicted lipoprotein with Yx(FWY)xxD motif
MTRSRPITFLASAAVVPLVALVNASGKTLYLFKADVGTKSACTGACATAWPPLLATGAPTAGSGLTASKLGTITRPGGKQQVTYNGHPLYLFIQDQKPGQTTGQGVTAFGAAWFALTPSGNQDSSPASSSGSGSGSGGY